MVIFSTLVSAGAEETRGGARQRALTAGKLPCHCESPQRWHDTEAAGQLINTRLCLKPLNKFFPCSDPVSCPRMVAAASVPISRHGRYAESIRSKLDKLKLQHVVLTATSCYPSSTWSIGSARHKAARRRLRGCLRSHLLRQCWVSRRPSTIHYHYALRLIDRLCLFCLGWVCFSWWEQ